MGWAAKRQDAIKAAMKQLGIKQPEYLWNLLKQAHPDVVRRRGAVKKVRGGDEAQSVANQILGNERVQFLQGLDEVTTHRSRAVFKGAHPNIKCWYGRQEFFYSVDLLQSQVFIDGATCDPKAIVTAMTAIGARGSLRPIQCALSSKGVCYCYCFGLIQWHVPSAWIFLGRCQRGMCALSPSIDLVYSS